MMMFMDGEEKRSELEPRNARVIISNCETMRVHSQCMSKYVT